MLAELLAGLQLAADCRAGDDFLRNMRKASSIKEEEDKIEYYGRAIRAWLPKDGKNLLAECHFRRGEARFRLWEFREAEPDLSKAIALDAGNSQARLLRARAFLRSGQATPAVRDAVDYTIMAPEDPEGFLCLGDARLALRDHNGSLSAFARAGRLDPEDFRAPLGEGRAHLGRGDSSRAADRLALADELARGRSPETQAAAAECALRRAGPGEALGAYSRALPLFEDRLQVLARENAPEGELAFSREAAAKTYADRGAAYESLNKRDEARADYRRSCELGREEACAKSDQPPSAARPARPKPQARPAEKPKRRPQKQGEDDPGERIYAN